MGNDTDALKPRFATRRWMYSRMGSTGGLEGRTLVSGLGWPADGSPAPAGTAVGWPSWPLPTVLPMIRGARGGVPAQLWAGEAPRALTPATPWSQTIQLPRPGAGMALSPPVAPDAGRRIDVDDVPAGGPVLQIRQRLGAERESMPSCPPVDARRDARSLSVEPGLG